MPVMEAVGDVVWDGTRRSREVPIGKKGRCGARTEGRKEQLERTQRRTSLLLVRQRREAAEAMAGGDTGRGVLSTMVVLRVDVAKLRYFNPKVQTDASFLRQVDFN